MSKKKEDLLIVRVFKKIINIRGWFDYDRVKAFTLYIGNSAKKLLVPPNKAPDHSFDEVMQKLNLTPADLELKKKALWRLSMLMLGCAGLIFAYAIYSVILGHWLAMLVSLVVMAIALVLAFRYHFWYFQICEHKLGCTLKEWYSKGLRSKHS